LDEIELSGIGRLVALTSDNEFNSLSTLQLTNDFGRAEIYQLPAGDEEKGVKNAVSRHLRGRLLFSNNATYNSLARWFAAGAVLKKTELTQEFDYDAFKAYYGDTAIPLFLIDQNNKLVIFTVDSQLKPKPGQKIISLIKADRIKEAEEAA
jgi:hypothetical protein